MDGETWAKLEKLVAPGIIKMKVINVACVLPILFYIYLTLHIFPSKFYPNSLQMICDFQKWWAFLAYDGFKSQVNFTDSVEKFAEEMIKVGKEEAGTSDFYQL